jgi:hypothetical protein
MLDRESSPRSVCLIDFTHLTAASILLVTFQNKSVATYHSRNTIHSRNTMTSAMKNPPSLWRRNDALFF